MEEMRTSFMRVCSSLLAKYGRTAHGTCRGTASGWYMNSAIRRCSSASTHCSRVARWYSDKKMPAAQ